MAATRLTATRRLRPIKLIDPRLLGTTLYRAQRGMIRRTANDVIVPILSNTQ